MTVKEVLKELKTLGSEEVRKRKERFAITAENSYGIFQKDLKVLAKKIGKNDALALELYDTGIYEARLLTRLLFNPQNLTDNLLEKWVKDFENWEICDSYCMSFIGSTKFAMPKALEWPHRRREFERRAGFVCMVGVAFKDRYASNDEVRAFFPLMCQYADDERTYAKKAINWALRQVGKRNIDLHKEAIEVAKEIHSLGNKSAKWIATDAIKQLTAEKVYFKNYPKKIYA